MNKQESHELQINLEETFPIIASGSYVRPFEVSSICWPLNWTYVSDKSQETIKWEYRTNSRGLPFFIYREKYSYTTIQADFTIFHANEREPDFSGMYLDREELDFNQAQYDSDMREKPTFKHNHVMIQAKVDESDMLRRLCKFDRKLRGALNSQSFFEGKTPVKKIPIEMMFEPVRQYLAIPLIAEFTCRGKGLPSSEEVLDYSRKIWEKVYF